MHRLPSTRSSGDYCWDYELSVSGTPGNPGAEPDISVSGSAAFGALEINTRADRTLTIANGGTADLLIGSLNRLSAPFSIVSDACSSRTLKVPSNDPNESVIVIAASGAGTKFAGNVLFHCKICICRSCGDANGTEISRIHEPHRG